LFFKKQQSAQQTKLFFRGNYMRCGGEGDSETTGNIVISILSCNLSLDAIVAVAAYSTMGD
jgi:hypothetical protein